VDGSTVGNCSPQNPPSPCRIMPRLLAKHSASPRTIAVVLNRPPWSRGQQISQKANGANPEKAQTSANALQRPDQNIQLVREVQQRNTRRQGDSRRVGHTINLNFSFCVLQRPKLVVNFSPKYAAVVNCV
jgi:hypothetical protein